MNPLWAGWPFLFAAVVVYGGWWVFRVISSGWTAVRAEKSIHRHGHLLARAAGKENR